MEAKAILKYARYSPLKMRKIVNGIKKNYSYNVSDALAVLKLDPTKGARMLEKLLNSAIANAIQKDMEDNNLRIKELKVDEGPGIKRMKPLSMGRAAVIKRRTSHITVVLTDEK